MTFQAVMDKTGQYFFNNFGRNGSKYIILNISQHWDWDWLITGPWRCTSGQNILLAVKLSITNMSPYKQLNNKFLLYHLTTALGAHQSYFSWQSIICVNCIQYIQHHVEQKPTDLHWMYNCWWNLGSGGKYCDEIWLDHDDDMAWKCFQHYWSFVRGMVIPRFTPQRARNAELWLLLCQLE